MAHSQPFNAFLAGFAATVGQFVLTGTYRRPNDLDLLCALR